MKLSQNAKRAFLIGAICSFSYFSVYIARNILGAVTPQMVEQGYSEEYIGTISSLYFVFYAMGQLINGAIGDKIKAKWMISMGLFGAAITNIIFSLTAHRPMLAIIVYATTGFFLSMIYGPMTKLVSENTEPVYATRCSLGYTFASFFGSPVAGLLASFLIWQNVFAVGSVSLIFMAAVSLCLFTVLENRKIIQYNRYKPEKKASKNLRVLLEHQIVKFAFVSVLTGVVRTSVVFWLPTYFAQYLNYSAETATVLFTVTTLAISLSSFIAVFVYERIGHDMNKTVLLMFSSSAVFFALTYFIKLPVLNISYITLAIMSSNGASTMLWSRYCPSLRDTGMVSSATGMLDFLSYMAAASANLVFSNAVSSIGWGNLILVWCGIMIIGVIVALPYRKSKR